MKDSSRSESMMKTIIGGILVTVIGGVILAIVIGEGRFALKSSPLDFAISYVYRTGGQGPFMMLPDHGTMRSGDHYKIIFTPSEDSFVYIFQIDAANKIYALFPLHEFRGIPVKLFNPVQANIDYYLPSKDKSFVLDQERGREHIYFVAFRQQNRELEDLYQQVVRTQDQPDAQNEMLTKQFIAAVDDKGVAKIVVDTTDSITFSWMEDNQTFSILRQQLEGMCNGCVNVLSFQHQ